VQATTWKDKITDTSNSWLAATRSEQDERYAEAVVSYLKDAGDSLTRGLKARAALSCSCAAGCLEKMGNGNAARRLYLEAAKMYEEQAEAVFGTSIREALWLLQEAHDHYIIGGDGQKAAEVYERCASLAKKSNPFVTSESLDQVLRIRRGAKPKPVAYSLQAAETSETAGAINGFMSMRQGKLSNVSLQVETQREKIRRRPSVEKSIVS
jgi:hypothetical protein